MKRSGNRILTIAIAGSLALHVIFAFTVRNLHPIQAKPEAPPQHVDIVVIHTPPPATPTPPPPAPSKSMPTRTTATVPSVHTTTTTNRRTSTTTERIVSGPAVDVCCENGSASPEPTVPATPTPTPKPACSVPNAPATTVDVVQATTPDGAEGATGTAKVEVTLSASGAVQDAKIYTPSGNLLLDRAAVKAARQSTYRAEIVDCMPTAGSYLFTVTFTE